MTRPPPPRPWARGMASSSHSSSATSGSRATRRAPGRRRSRARWAARGPRWPAAAPPTSAPPSPGPGTPPRRIRTRSSTTPSPPGWACGRRCVPWDTVLGRKLGARWQRSRKRRVDLPTGAGPMRVHVYRPSGGVGEGGGARLPGARPLLGDLPANAAHPPACGGGFAGRGFVVAGARGVPRARAGRHRPGLRRRRQGQGQPLQMRPVCPSYDERRQGGRPGRLRLAAGLQRPGLGGRWASASAGIWRSIAASNPERCRRLRASIRPTCTANAWARGEQDDSLARCGEVG